MKERLGPDRQHGLGRGNARRLRPGELLDHQGGNPRPDADARDGGRPLRITCNAIVPGIIGTEAFHFANPAMNERIANRTVQAAGRAGGHRERDLLPLLRPRQLHHRRRAERQRRRRAVRVLMPIARRGSDARPRRAAELLRALARRRPGDRYERPETGYTSYFSFDDGARLELMSRLDIPATKDSPHAQSPDSSISRSARSEERVDALTAQLRRPASRCSIRATGDGYYESLSSTPTATGSS